MTRLERYREQLAKLEEKRSTLLRSGRFIEANNLNNDLREIEMLIKQAEEYEEATKPKPLKDIVTKKQLNEMGIIPLMIECHLAADFLTGVAYSVVDICKKHGFSDVVLMPDLQDIIKKTEKFASFLTKVSPELCKLVTENDTFNESVHKKYLKYIEQRLK